MTICNSCMPYLATWHQIQITIQFFSYPSDYVYVTGYIIYFLKIQPYMVIYDDNEQKKITSIMKQ